MLEQICAFIHNYFCHSVTHGTFKVRDGVLDVDLVPGQYYRIIGSRFNDGVHVYLAEDLMDETFEGEVWDMRPPRAFIALVNEIEAWQEKNGEAASGPYQSESFGGYSYTLATSQTANGVTLTGWQNAFRTRLNEWRKLA